MDVLFEVISETDALLVVNKPAGLVCHPTKSGIYSSLISRARIYLGENSAPQLINRLDRETSGLVLIAKNSVAARQLRRTWEARAVEKEYWAIVHGWPKGDGGTLDGPLGKDPHSPVAIKDMVRPGGAPARTEFQVATRFKRGDDCFAWLRVHPQTGRKHQIRIHLAAAGHPIVGDKLYGPDERLYLAFVEGRLRPEDRARLLLPFHALHARSVRLHWEGQSHVFRAKPESWFVDFGHNGAPGGVRMQDG